MWQCHKFEPSLIPLKSILNQINLDKQVGKYPRCHLPELKASRVKCFFCFCCNEERLNDSDSSKIQDISESSQFVSSNIYVCTPSLSLLCFWILILCICVSRNVSINASPTFKKFQRRLFLYESNLCGFFDFSDT